MNRKSMEKKRCLWAENDPLNQKYHDQEWGVPNIDDRTLFEFLILEGAQAGLNWITILKRREEYRKAFDDFDPMIVSKYDQKKKDELLKNEGIIRNRLKIESAVINAQNFLIVQKEFQSFAHYLWSFVGFKPQDNQLKDFSQIQASTKISDALSKDLKKRGFKFVGSTICYAYMQAIGMVNDHTTDCFRHKECQKHSLNFCLPVS